MIQRKKTSHHARLMLTIAAGMMLMASCKMPGDSELSRGGITQAKRPKLQQQQLSNICNKILEKEADMPLTSRTELRDRFLKSHNEIRALYGLTDLTWDNNLADYAQRWANYLRDKYKCVMQHRRELGVLEGENYGENLAWNWTSVNFPADQFSKSPEFANLGWSKECNDYDFADGSCTSGKKCGHFTQVVWEDSSKVGCGVAICDDKFNSEGHGRAEVWVCNYDPPGNVRIRDQRGKITKLNPF